jgi:hypothetical protein
VPDEQVSKVIEVGIDLVECGKRRLVALDIAENPLLRGVAPAGMAPDLRLVAQTLDSVVEELDEIVGVEPAKRLTADGHHMDLRFLELDHRAAGIGQLNELPVERIAQCPDPFDRILVIFVGDRGGEQFGKNGSELDRLLGQPLRHFPHRGVLQIAGTDRPDDLRQHARFEEVVQNVPARRPRDELIGARFRRYREARHVGQRIALPAHAADLLIEMRIAIGADVEPSSLLRAQIDRNRIFVLLAVS